MTAQRNTKRVKLEDLFRWNHELEIRGPDGEVSTTIYQRILNERETDKARLTALRGTRDLRMSLQAEGTDENAAVLENILQLNRDQKVSVVMLEDMPNIYDRAQKNINMKMPTPPIAGAELSEIEEYEALVDSYDERVNDAMTNLIEEYTKGLRVELLALEEEEFAKRVLSSMENQICVNFMTERFTEEVASRSVYQDAAHKKRLFADIDAYDALAQEVREQIERGYMDLELSRGALKN